MYYPCPPTSELVKSKIAQSIRVTSNIRKQHFPILVSSKPPQKDQSLSSACCPGGKTKKTKHFPIVRSRPLSTKPSFSFKGADEPTRETHSLFQRRRRTSRSKLTRFRLTRQRQENELHNQKKYVPRRSPPCEHPKPTTASRNDESTSVSGLQRVCAFAKSDAKMRRRFRKPLTDRRTDLWLCRSNVEGASSLAFDGLSCGDAGLLFF